MNTPSNQAKVQPSDALVATPAGPRLLTAAELLQISGGAPRGGWVLPDPVPNAAAVTGPETEAPRGGW